MRKFSNYVYEYLTDIARGNIIVLIGDMNGRIGNNEITCVVRKWSVDGVNETWCPHVHMSTWQNKGGMNSRECLGIQCGLLLFCMNNSVGPVLKCIVEGKPLL